MSRLPTLFAPLLASVLAPVLAFAAWPATAAPPALPGWLAGTWAMEDGAAWSEEMWSAPRGGVMLGLDRKGFGPDVTSWEYVRIERGRGGGLVLVAQPQGGPPVEYALAVASEAAIEFANPAQEFPQRIRYWREGQLLMAEVSRIDGSGTQRWNYRPVAGPVD